MLEEKVEVRICPLGPPQKSALLAYALCSECSHIRRNKDHCPMVKDENRNR